MVSSTTLIYLLPLGAWLWNKKPRHGRKAILIFSLCLLGGLAAYSLIAGPTDLFINANNPFNKVIIEGWLFFPRVVRNMAVIYFNYLTIPLGLACLFLGLRKKNAIFVLSWLLALFILSSLWHAGMYGRLSLPLVLLPLFLLTRIKNRLILGGLFILLLIQSAKLVLPYHFREVPDWQEKKMVEQLSPDFY